MSRLPTLPWFFDELRAHSSSKRLGCPLEFGRPPVTQEVVTRSIIWIDVQRGDSGELFAAPQGSKRPRVTSNQKQDAYIYPFTRGVRCEALIHALSPAPGARRKDHVELCDRLVNDLTWALYETARDCSVMMTPASGGYPIAPGDEASIQIGSVENGARYLLVFELLAPIVSQPFPTAEIAATANTINIPYGGSSTTIEV